jgi:nucleoprotein TPR
VDLARSNAQKQMIEERFKMLSETNTRQNKEIKDTSKRNMELQSSMARQDEATRRVTEEVLDLKGSLDRVKHEAMMLKAEKEVWKVGWRCCRWINDCSY